MQTIRLAVSVGLSSETYRRLLRNAGWLLGGNAAGGVLSLLSMFWAARLLGPTEFGIIALVTTYVALIDRFFNFQTWQALIRHGARARETADKVALARLVKVCALLDIGSALIAAAVATLAAGLTARLFGLGDEVARLMVFYSIVILTNLVGAPTAVLRLFDHFRVLAAASLFGGCATLVGVALCWVLGAGLGGVLLSLALGQTFGNLYIVVGGWRTLAREGVCGVWASPLRGIRQDEPDLLSFVFWTNIESSVKILREIDVFVIKALMSIEAVGLYFAARRVANAMLTVIAPFTYAIYPEFAKLVAAGNSREFNKLFLRSAISVFSFAAVIFVAFLFFGEEFLAVALGEEYRSGFMVTAVCLFGTVVWAATQPLSPAMFSLGMVRQAFIIHLVVACFYLATLAPLIKLAGLAGAGAGFAFLFVFWGVLAAYVLKRKLALQSGKVTKV